MLPRPLRVVRPAEHREIARRGTRAGTSSLVVHLSRESSLPGDEVTGPVGPARAGVVVGRAVGDAVTRHRVARRLRHLLAARLSAVAPDTTLVVRARPGAATASSAALGADLDAALARAGRSRTGRPRS